jgi:hypothetical protein
MMETAISNAKSYDVATWVLGIFRSFVSGGSSAVVSGFAAIGIAPDRFNFADGMGKTFKMMGVMFLFVGIYRMCEFLALHGAPDKLTQSLDEASVATRAVATQANQAVQAVDQAMTQAAEEKK